MTESLVAYKMTNKATGIISLQFAIYCAHWHLPPSKSH